MLIEFIKPGDLKSANATRWTELMEQLLRDNYRTRTNVQMAAALGLTLTVIRNKMHELGLIRVEMEYWTEEQVKYLRNNYQKMGDTEMAELFEKRWPKHKKWTDKHIRKKRIYLNLRRTKMQTQSILERNIECGRYAVCAEKRWAKAYISPVGEIKVWCTSAGNKFKVIKTRAGFVHYAPWLYRKTFGKIPKGYIVSFKDRDNMNVVPENLELITRADQARRMVTRYPAELRKIIRAFNKLKKKIKQKTDV
jgi:hypothetical protein